ncbi:coproporphyrinogen III oxidase, partial [Geitlerinema sp. P-1104]|uniref:coproporphyrinogen III oxidase n=1 Tax=Geitlerinema sp. P-1104 TaxID=2546230 RepID=UPI0014777F2D
MSSTSTPPVSPLSTRPPEDSQARISTFMKNLQESICAGLERLDGGGQFREDMWERPEGGGGRSRVIREGNIFEQGGVNFSEVFGEKLPPSILKQRPEAEGHGFYATGTSMVLHPRSP